MTRPTPYDDSKENDRFWTQGKYKYDDPFDLYLPRPGFITDVLYSLRGTEVPSVYTIWGCLSALSAAIKREGWLKWEPGREFFCNLYVILVGPAGGKKTTMVERVLSWLGSYHEYIDDYNIKKIKTLNVLKNKATPEAILEAMLVKNAFYLKSQDGSILKNAKTGLPYKYKGSSELVLGLHEMSVMINKQKYTESLIQNMLDLYDCHSTWDWRSKGEGKRVLKNLFTSLLAATTIEGFMESIPKAAVGDGFLSRTVIAYSGMSERDFWRPRKPKFAPTEEDIMQRLAYVAQVMQGEFDLTKEADEYGEQWYKSFKNDLRKTPADLGVRSRMNINLLKLAFLMKAQSYPELGDNTIGVEELKEAERLLRITYLTSKRVLNEIKTNGEFKTIAQIKAYIEERKEVSRKQILAGTRVPANELSQVIYHLFQEGCIEAVDAKSGKTKDNPTSGTAEVYRWVGDNEDEETWKKAGNG